ncbi:MAG TPA: nitroreductase/quinone reductase family protein [Myxococcota bacterium]|nr:nitroreductase/quinone reductase family protein [Myxococcota bacterium]
MTRASLVAAALWLAACGGPIGWIHDGRLDGQVVSAPVDDWSFTRDVQTVQLETSPNDPYSVNVWCVAKGANLWVTAGSHTSTWAKNLLADPRLRVRVGDKLYERLALQVTDAAEVELVLSLYEEKYDYERDPNGAFGPLQFRLDPR